MIDNINIITEMSFFKYLRIFEEYNLRMQRCKKSAQIKKLYFSKLFRFFSRKKSRKFRYQLLVKLKRSAF